MHGQTFLITSYNYFHSPNEKYHIIEIICAIIGSTYVISTRNKIIFALFDKDFMMKAKFNLHQLTPLIPLKKMSLKLFAIIIVTIFSVIIIPSLQDAHAVSNGKIAFVSNRDQANGEIYTMNDDGTGVARLTLNLVVDSSPTWSPDGTKIAFVSYRDGNYEIYSMNADGTGVTRLTSNTVSDVDPSWSPDSTKIAFASYRDSSIYPEIYVMNVDGTGQTRLTISTFKNLTPSWSPDGTKIAFASTRDNGYYQLYTMNPDGTGVTRMTNISNGDGWPSWSHDGTKIAFERGVTGEKIGRAHV